MDHTESVVVKVAHQLRGVNEPWVDSEKARLRLLVLAEPAQEGEVGHPSVVEEDRC